MSPKSEHERTVELLPWYVNDTLTGPDREFVDRHLSRCVPCRLALREEQSLQSMVRKHPSIHISSERDFERLARKLDEQPGAGRSGLAARMRSFAGQYGLAASVLFAVLAAAVLVTVGGPPAEFETLTTGAPQDSIRLDVVFIEGVTESELRDFVQGAGASVVDGPSEVGRYTIELDSSAYSQAELEDLVTSLRADQRVRFVGRSYVPERSQP